MSTKAIAHAADLPALVERYFCEYLIKQRNASPETISSYRDAFRLFLRFSEQRFGRAPATLTLADFDAPQILAFLDSLEKQRHCSVRSRNARLAALRSFLQYAACRIRRLWLQSATALPSPSSALTACRFLISRKKKSPPFLMLRTAVPGAAIAMPSCVRPCITLAPEYPRSSGST